MDKLLSPILAGTVLLLLIFPPMAGAQIKTGSKSRQTSRLPYPAAPESLTVTISSGSAVSFALKSNTPSNRGSATTTVVTSWTSLKTTRNSVAVWAYFTSATAALVHQTPANTMNIPSAAVSIQINGTGLFTALTNISPFNGAASGLEIAKVAITYLNRTGSVTDTLTYNIDTTKVPQLPADAYVGTLNIQAQATP